VICKLVAAPALLLAVAAPAVFVGVLIAGMIISFRLETAGSSRKVERDPARQR
jgi:hypothetical protein